MISWTKWGPKVIYLRGEKMALVTTGFPVEFVKEALKRGFPLVAEETVIDR